MSPLNSKEVAIGVLNLIFALAFGFIGRGVFASIGASNYAIFSFPIALLLLWSVIFGMLGLFVVDKRIIFGTVIFSLLIQYFFTGLTLAQAGIVLIAVILGIVSVRRIKKESENSISWNIRRSLKEGLPLFFTSLALVSSVFYFNSLDEAGASFILPKPIFNFSLSLFQKQLNQILPGFDANLTVDKILAKAFENQSGKKASSTPKSELNSFIASGRAELSKQLEQNIKGNEKAGDVLYDWSNKRLKEFVNPYGVLLSFVLALSVFLLVKTLSWPLYWLAILITLGITKILVRYNFLKVTRKPVEIERLIL